MGALLRAKALRATRTCPVLRSPATASAWPVGRAIHRTLRRFACPPSAMRGMTRQHVTRDTTIYGAPEIGLAVVAFTPIVRRPDPHVGADVLAAVRARPDDGQLRVPHKATSNFLSRSLAVPVAGASSHPPHRYPDMQGPCLRPTGLRECGAAAAVHAGCMPCPLRLPSLRRDHTAEAAKTAISGQG